MTKEYKAKTTNIVTSVKVFKPEIVELLAQVERQFGRKISTPSDYYELSMELLEKKCSVSTATLKRLWGYVADVHQPREKTLDALACYIGQGNFEQFCSYLKTSTDYDSSSFLTKLLSISGLNAGERIEIGWAPNRVVKLEYVGNAIFKVLESHNSKLQEGDCFQTGGFVMGQPLIVPYILRNGKHTPAYIAGKNGGLTLLKRLNRE